MELKVKGIGSLVAAALLAFAPATQTRADVWVYEVLTLRPEAPPHQADAYVGAVGVLARRHGGSRVESVIEPASADGASAGRVVGLWRFNDVGSLDSLFADPTYRSLVGLHDRTFDSGSSRSLERVRALAGPSH